MRPRQEAPAVVDVAAADASVIEGSLRDPEQFAVLFDRHGPRIHRYLARRAGRHVADDLLAETFLAAFARRHRYQLGYADARPWLYGIATNLVGQHRRDEARQQQIIQAVPAQPVVPGHADRVVADVTAQGTRALLGAALARLAPGDRDVLLLIAWEQLTYQEVSIALAIPVGTVRSRLHRARAIVRQLLADTDAAASELLSQAYLSSRQRAGLYDLMARTPGFTLIPHTSDGIGRPGVGIAWPAPVGAGNAIIIFNPNTYAELGITTHGAGGATGFGALLKLAIVNKPGQLP